MQKVPASSGTGGWNSEYDIGYQLLEDKNMTSRLIIDGNSVYEIDEECERGKQEQGDVEQQPGGQSRKEEDRKPGQEH